MALRGGFNARSPTVKRILQESRDLTRNPDAWLTAAPLEDNLFEWHFTLAGPPSSAFEGGIYHGRIVLPPSYPLRPPMFRFLTPSGRFEVNREICLSISGHHEETWQPAWGIRTALCAIRAFMESDAKGQIGGIDCPESVRRAMARESRGWRCPVCADHDSLEQVMDRCRQAVEEAAAVVREREGKDGGEYENERRKREEVPQELRLAYKDELEKEKEKATTATTTPSTPSTPVTPAPPVAGATNGLVQRSESEAPNARPSPATSTAVNTSLGGSNTTATRVNAGRADAAQAPVAVRPSVRQTTAPVSNADGVPAWVDKSIFAVIVCLVFMLLKKAFV